MAKRGRPSKKTLKKRREAKQKSELAFFIGLLFIVALLVAGYFMFF